MPESANSVVFQAEFELEDFNRLANVYTLWAQLVGIFKLLGALLRIRTRVGATPPPGVAAPRSELRAPGLTPKWVYTQALERLFFA